MGFSKEEFYDASKVAILPIGLCYPGRAGSGGDAPPRPECATLWRERLLGQMPALKITLLVGSYAQKHALGYGVMTARVRKDRKSVVTGKSVSVRDDLGGRRIIRKKKHE